MNPLPNDGEDRVSVRGLTMAAGGKSMPISSKLCHGELSEETQQLLRKTGDRAQWAAHPCTVCGRTVGVEEAGGRWMPERHCPSVTHQPGNGSMRRG